MLFFAALRAASCRTQNFFSAIPIAVVLTVQRVPGHLAKRGDEQHTDLKSDACSGQRIFGSGTFVAICREPDRFPWEPNFPAAREFFWGRNHEAVLR
jgi:hypothetical protein